MGFQQEQSYFIITFNQCFSPTNNTLAVVFLYMYVLLHPIPQRYVRILPTTTDTSTVYKFDLSIVGGRSQKRSEVRRKKAHIGIIGIIGVAYVCSIKGI